MGTSCSHNKEEEVGVTQKMAKSGANTSDGGKCDKDCMTDNIVELVNPRFKNYKKKFRLPLAIMVGVLTYAVVFAVAYMNMINCTTSSGTMTFPDHHTFEHSIKSSDARNVGGPWTSNKCIRTAFFLQDWTMNAKDFIASNQCDPRESLTGETKLCPGAPDPGMGSYSGDEAVPIPYCDQVLAEWNIYDDWQHVVIVIFETETCTEPAVAIGSALGFAFVIEFFFTVIIAFCFQKFCGMEPGNLLTEDHPKLKEILGLDFANL